jgi:DinB superfamily
MLPGLTQLENTPEILRLLLDGLTPEEAIWKPAPDRWSIAEVLAHMADVEVAVFRGRIEKMMAEKNPAVLPYDQNAAYAEGKYSRGRARENLKLFCHERDRSLSALRYVTLAAAGRTAKHAELGTITVGQIMNQWAFHDLGHIKQISELYRTRAFHPYTGPFQAQYAVKP